MKTLDYRTSENIELVLVKSTDEFQAGCIEFVHSKEYNHYTDGSVELFKEYFTKNDQRECVRSDYRTYSSKKAWSNAINRAKKTI